MPVDPKNNIEINKEFVCSNYTGWREITIRNPAHLAPLPMLEPKSYSSSKVLKTGFLGLGEKQEANFTVELPKQVFALGEQITIKVFTDNSACAKAMEQIKVRLHYTCVVNATHRGLFTINKNRKIGPLKVFSSMGQQISAKSVHEQLISFTIPTTLEKGYCPWGYYMPNN